MLPVEGTTTSKQVPKLLEKAKLAFTQGLRIAFASEITDPSLKYIEGSTDSKIKIYPTHPQTLEFFPSLIVSAAGGDASFTYMQDDYIGGGEESFEQRYAGRVVFNINISILASKTVERERMVDHLIFFTRHLFRGTFHGFDVEFTKDISLSGENTFEVDNKPVYEQVLSIPCYMEYNATVDQSGLDTIRSLIVDTTVPVEL